MVDSDIQFLIAISIFIIGIGVVLKKLWHGPLDFEEKDSN